MSAEEAHTYDEYFDNLDVNRQGYVTGSEAREVFMTSKLTNQLLAEIWLVH